MSLITIKAMFITASGRNVYELAEAASIPHPEDMINEAIAVYQLYQNAQKAGEILACYDNERDCAIPLTNTVLNPALPLSDIVTATFADDSEALFKQEFETDDVPGVLSAALYLYDRVITESQDGYDVILTDNPDHIRTFRPVIRRISLK